MKEITGNLSDGIEALSKVLNLKGKVVPLTEDNVILMGEMMDGTVIEGEHNITQDKRKIKKVFYKEKAEPTKEAIKAIKEADLIILSMGSLFTSIIPNLICDGIVDAIDKSNAKIMYISNIMTQPGETENFKVSDHINLLNKYLKNKKIDVVVSNTGKVNKKLAKKYETLEQKDPVLNDSSNIDCEVISDDLILISNNVIRHNPMKLGFHIFYYLMQL